MARGDGRRGGSEVAGEGRVLRPTEAELELLRVLWGSGPGTVAEVHRRRARGGGGVGTGYTTTLKLLQRMADKGLVRRDESRRSHVYRAAVGEEVTQRQLVRDLMRRAFGGSPGRLVVQALSEERASAADLEEIRRLLDEIERGGNPGGEQETR